MNAEVIA